MNSSSTTERVDTILTRKLGDVPGTGAGEGADRRIEVGWWSLKRILMLVAVIAALALLAWGYTSSLGGPRFRIEAERLTIAAIERGPFQEYAQVTGNLMPRTTVYLDAVEGGRVEQVFVEEGTRVTAGQPLLRLSNNDLQLRLINADAQRIEQINRVQDTQFRMEQNALNLRQQLSQMDYEIQRLTRDEERNRVLFERQLISKQEYDQTHDELAYWHRTRRLTLEGYRHDSLRTAEQLARMRASVHRMDANFDVIQGILDDLVVRAPISGQLTALDVEVGELHASGSRFGQIDEIGGFKLRAGVDEFYLTRVVPGQLATTLPVAGNEYAMVVTRVYPQVREGRFEVDLEFVGDAPPGARRGQTIRFRLEMSDSTEAILLPRGGFFQTTGGNWVFVVEQDGTARRRDIQVGRQNPQFLEVTAGLRPGERVVTSSYETFADVEILVLE